MSLLSLQQSALKKLATILRGNDIPLKLSLTALLSEKSILIEDMPGKGKTVLAKLMAKLFNLDFKRIQFTNDLMPADIIGFNFFHQEKSEFIFRPGPIFGQLILADEINRASSRTQSALLQAMEEKQVSVENATYDLPENFFVIATQNPHDHVGTTPLPESQLDRFLFKFKMSDLTSEQELELLKAGSQHQKLSEYVSDFSPQDLKKFKQQKSEVKISQTLFEWITFFLQKSRSSKGVEPLGSRVGIDFIEGLKSWAYIHERREVISDDIVELFPYCFAHRLFRGKNLSVDQEQGQAVQWLKNLS